MIQYRFQPGYYIKKAGCLSVFLMLHCFSIAQCPTNLQFIGKIENEANNTRQIAMNDVLAYRKELSVLYPLKAQFENCHLVKDSVYARLLFLVSRCEFGAKRDYNACISFGLQSIAINTSGRNDCSRLQAMKGYFSMAAFYRYLTLNDKCLAYCDSSMKIALSTSAPVSDTIIFHARLMKADIYFEKGDFQKFMEEGMNGMKYALEKNDSVGYLKFLNRKAYSLVMQNQFEPALTDLKTIFGLAERLHAAPEAGYALKTAAVLYSFKKNYKMAHSFYKLSIQSGISNILYNSYGKLINDYTDWGNLYLGIGIFPSAQNCYANALKYAEKTGSPMSISRIYASMEDCSFKQKDYEKATTYCLQALAQLKIKTEGNILANSFCAPLDNISDKDLALTIMNNKVELLLGLFSKTKESKYLTASINNAMVTDSLITNMRRGQTGEQSKLFWRNNTRSFYANALEACFLANDVSHAYYFLEKSRAVLLNDKLAELGATAHLPATEAANEQALLIKVFTEQEKLNALAEAPTAYQDQYIKLIDAKDAFNKYIKTLEQKYPVYCQYKYADEVTPLSALQLYLKANKQSFVHYFVTDAVYILVITATNTEMVKVSSNDFNPQKLTKLLQVCSNIDSLNDPGDTFAALSYDLYKKLFEPLGLEKGRVVICQENYFVPFEVFCSDRYGKLFLLNDYSFSYVYSARSLIKRPAIALPNNDFLGLAPVTFPGYLRVPPLIESAHYLKLNSAYYQQPKLLTGSAGTKSNFVKNFRSFAVVNIFSHASAGNSNNEPYIYTADSILRLSELALLSNKFTQLIVLSACQTNNGINASGEGVYSMARGFAAAGVPSVAATLWDANERSIYSITTDFHKNLAAGMSKDESLQQAKLSYIRNNSGENLSPFYWANLIIVGNAEPLIPVVPHFGFVWVMTAIVFLIALSYWCYRQFSAKKSINKTGL